MKGAIWAWTAATLLAGTSSPAASGRDAKDAAYDGHLAKARAAASGVATNLLNLCNLPAPQGASPSPPGAVKGAAALGPARVFDQLYYVGLPGVSAWALKTSDGIILIDALNYPRDAETTILPAMRASGLNPADIRYVVVTHGHADHFGAAPYFQDTMKVRIIASEADWRLMEGPSPFPDAPYRQPPRRDMVVGDGDTLTLGKTTIRFRLTPGHTPGTLSLLIPVTDRGIPHVAALWGGTGFNFQPTAANFLTYANSARRFGGLARAAGADIFLSNHPFVDDTPRNLEILTKRGPNAPNPYVVGQSAVRDAFTVAEECARARAAAL